MPRGDGGKPGDPRQRYESKETKLPKKLAKRIANWEELFAAHDVDAKTKSHNGFHFHKPGSQNRSK
jgi:hypothetical protein